MDAVGVLSAAGNLDRARILDAFLESGRTRAGMSIAELAGRCELDRSTASRHLAMLRSVGLVADVRVGYRRVHHLRAQGFELIEDWLIPFTEAADMSA